MEQNVSTQLTSSRLCDIGVVVKDLDKTIKRLEDYGFGPFNPAKPPEGAEGLYYRGKPFTSDFRGLVVNLGDVGLEVIEPNSKPNPWEDFLETRGEGFHHIGFKVDDVEQEVNRLTALGAEVILTGKVNGKLAAAYVDLKVANLVFELMSYQGSERNAPANKTYSKPWAMLVLVKDIDQAAERLKNLGIVEPKVHAGPPEGADGLFFNNKPFESKLNVRIFRVGNMMVELLQPDDKPNPWTGFLNRKGEGIHHVDFYVDQVEKEVNRLKDQGAEVPLYGKIYGKMGDAYVDLKIADLVIELTSFTF